MSRATRFSVAIHALAMLQRPDEHGGRTSSEAIAQSVGTNASFVRRVLAMLAHGGIVTSSPGIAGAQLARPAAEISLLEIYRAVGLEGEVRLGIHGSPSLNCPVGRRIQGALATVVDAAEAAFEEEFRRRRLSDVLDVIGLSSAGDEPPHQPSSPA